MHHHLTERDMSPASQLGQTHWLRSALAADLGQCHNDSIRLDDGLALVYTDYCPRQDLRQSSLQERDCRVLTLSIALEGHSSTLGADGQRFDFSAGHSTLTAFSSVRSERRFNAGQRIRQVRLIAEEPLLHKYALGHLLDRVGDGLSATHLYSGQFDQATGQLAQRLVQLHQQQAGCLDLQIAALNLLAEQTRRFQPAIRPTTTLRATDQTQLLAARDILLTQFHLPLTIGYLCARVGTNEFKLKQGFRQLFGTSPYRMLTDIRMQHARSLLEEGRQVSSVAYKVGYQHLSSFSAAFSRYYGHSPKSLARPAAPETP